MKLRHRAKGSKRLKFAGKSSESNPRTKRHRDAAKLAHVVKKAQSLSMDVSNGSSNGNMDPVLQQLPLHTMQINDFEARNSNGRYSAQGSVASDAFSDLSHFTACTNTTFDPVHRVWKSRSVLQKDVLAVLAVTTDIIKAKNGKESDTEYFVTLLSTIEATPVENEKQLAAAAYLLGLVSNKVDRNVLQTNFAKTLQVIDDKISDCEGGDAYHVALVKLIDVLGRILQCQPACVWQSSTTRSFILKLGIFATHDKGAVRKIARQALGLVLNDPIAASKDEFHPAAHTFGDFIIKQLEKYAGSRDVDLPLHLLCLAEGLMHKMPNKILQSFLELCLSLLVIPELRHAVYQCIYRILQRQPSERSLCPGTCLRLLITLRDSAPLYGDSLIFVWMQALCEAHACLSLYDATEAVKALPTTFQRIIGFYDKGSQTTAEGVTKIICRLLEYCVQNNEELATICLDLCDKALNAQNVLVWRHILRADAKIFEVCKDAVHDSVFDRALKTLASLREDPQCSVSGDIDLAVGAAVRYVGVERVIQAIPLDIVPANIALTAQFQRSWLMPILRLNIFKAPLSLALKYFLPIAHQIRLMLPKLKPDVAKVYATIRQQIWHLLPTFLSSAIDFESTFPALADVIGKALHEQPDIRLILLSSLRSALGYANKPDATMKKLELMESYAYSFLRVLFGLYTCEGSDIASEQKNSVLRMSILETARFYIVLTPDDVIDNFINMAVEKEQDADMTKTKKALVMDVVAILVRKAGVSGVQIIFSMVQPLFSSSDSILQKKAFRVLEEIYKRRSEDNLSGFFESHTHEIKDILEQGMDDVGRVAYASLISIYNLHLLSLGTFEEAESFVKEVVEQVILCMDKSNNVRTRENAVRCFISICDHLILLGPQIKKTPSYVFQIVLERIYDLLTSYTEDGTQQLEIARSANVALNVVVQKNIRLLDATHISGIMGHACNWIGDGRPAVRILVIRLVRMLVKKLPDYTLQQYQDLLLGAVFDGQLTPDVTHKVRKANRLLLETLIDRFGIDILMKKTEKPEWIKQMKAIVKQRRRKERKGRGEFEIVDTGNAKDVQSLVTTAYTAGADTILDLLPDSDIEDGDVMDDDRRTLVGRSHASSVWLKEGDDNDMVDLLDRNTLLKKITTTRPIPSAARQIKEGDCFGGFKTDKSGKLVIEEKDEQSANEMDITLNDDESDDDNVTVSQNKSWKPGGHGIHRDINKKNEKVVQKRKKTDDIKKKGAKFEPYAYIPLRGCKRTKKDLQKMMKGLSLSAPADEPKLKRKHI